MSDGQSSQRTEQRGTFGSLFRAAFPWIVGLMVFETVLAILAPDVFYAAESPVPLDLLLVLGWVVVPSVFFGLRGEPNGN